MVVSVNTKGQIIKTKLDIIGGLSAREYFHAGLRYQYTDITQLGIYYGGDIDIYPEVINTYSIDNMIHFGLLSYHFNRPAWYARQGYTYVISTEVDRKRKFSYVDLSAGREFGIKDWLGVNVDLGLILQVREKMEWNDPAQDSWYRNELQWMPLFRVQMFLSL
jgi:hypothetical protein